MNRKLMLGIIIVLVVLILIIVALLIAGPKDIISKSNNSTAGNSNLANDLDNLDSGDSVIYQDLNSEIVNLEE